MNSFSTYISDKIRNIAGNYINPATEEKQDAIVSAIENITIPAPVGGATEAKQDSLEILTQGIYELIERLSFLPSIRGTLSDIRVSSTGGTVGISSLPTLATVSTLSNQTSVGGYLANPQIPGMMNNTAIQSNISNIIIS